MYPLPPKNLEGSDWPKKNAPILLTQRLNKEHKHSTAMKALNHHSTGLLALFGAYGGHLAVVAGQSASSSSLEAAASSIPTCDQENTVLIATTLTQYERKKECEHVLGVKEMYEVTDTSLLCNTNICLVALEYLYNALPHCKYQTWAVQNQTAIILEYDCDVTDANATVLPVTDASAEDALGKFNIDTEASASSGSPAPVGWRSSSESGSNDFAPVGLEPTTTPTATTVKSTTPSTTGESSAVSIAILSPIVAMLLGVIGALVV